MYYTNHIDNRKTVPLWRFFTRGIQTFWKNTIYLRLDPKEEILRSIRGVAEKENIRLAQVTGLGAINEPHCWRIQHRNKGIPLYSVSGSLWDCFSYCTATRKDGEVYLHSTSQPVTKKALYTAVIWTVPFISATRSRSRWSTRSGREFMRISDLTRFASDFVRGIFDHCLMLYSLKFHHT